MLYRRSLSSLFTLFIVALCASTFMTTLRNGSDIPSGSYVLFAHSCCSLSVFSFPSSPTKRGVFGLDPSTQGRSPVVLEVRFRSRALLKSEIQSEIVPGYLHYLGFCTVLRLVVHSHFACRNTIFRCSSHLVFLTFIASVTMPKKLRLKCLGGR